MIKLVNRTVLSRVVILAMSILSPLLASAQEYPVRPVRLVIPFAPGTGIDAVGRMLAQQLAADLGQPIVVDNRPGASGIIGAEFVAKAAPDGHTLLFAAGSIFSLNPILFAKLPYDGVKSFTPVSFVYSQPFVVATSLKVPAKTLPELVSLAREKPDTLTAGSVGAFHVLATQYFANTTKTRFVNVPYKSGTMVALLAGEIDVMVEVISLVVPQSKAGKIRALAVTSEKRMPNAPDVPTMIELGYPGFEMSTWSALVGPANMQRSIADKLNAAVAKAILSRELVDLANTQGIRLAGSTPEQLVQTIRAETTRWQSVARDAGITPQ